MRFDNPGSFGHISYLWVLVGLLAGVRNLQVTSTNSLDPLIAASRTNAIEPDRSSTMVIGVSFSFVTAFLLLWTTFTDYK